MKKNLLILLSLILCGCNQPTTSSEESSESIVEQPSSEAQLVSVKYENPVYDHDFADPSYVKCEEDGYYYFEMNDDVTVNVTYKVDELKNNVNNADKEENPETNDISNLMILVLVVALVIYYCSYTGIKKKSI